MTRSMAICTTLILWETFCVSVHVLALCISVRHAQCEVYVDSTEYIGWISGSSNNVRSNRFSDAAYRMQPIPIVRLLWSLFKKNRIYPICLPIAWTSVFSLSFPTIISRIYVAGDILLYFSFVVIISSLGPQAKASKRFNIIWRKSIF